MNNLVSNIVVGIAIVFLTVFFLTTDWRPAKSLGWRK